MNTFFSACSLVVMLTYLSGSDRDRFSRFSFATRDDDHLFSSFVNGIVLGMIRMDELELRHAESDSLPLLTQFGTQLTWALRDGKEYGKSYYALYEKHFGKDEPVEMRGRNALNVGGPQIHSFPGLVHRG